MKLKTFEQIAYLAQKNKFPYWKLFEKDRTRRIPVMNFLSPKESGVSEEDFMNESIETLRELVEAEPETIFSIEFLRTPKSSKDSRMGFFDFVLEEEPEEEAETPPQTQGLMGLPPNGFQMFLQMQSQMMALQNQGFTQLLETRDKMHRAETETLLSRFKSEMEILQKGWEISMKEKDLENRLKNSKKGGSNEILEGLLSGVLGGGFGQNTPQITQTGTQVLEGVSEMPDWYKALSDAQKDKINRMLQDEPTRKSILQAIENM